MALIVQKYGGTSVGNPERIRNCARRILETQRAGNQVVAVVSAMSGVTDSLIKLSKEVSPEQDPSEREMDVLLSTGEQTTIALTAMAGPNERVRALAAGFKDAKVVARFPTEGTDDASYLDLSTPYNEAIQEAERRRSQGQ